ncbi:Alb1-domain-containing protein [Coniella lustricola]|uniref:Alb1-domain-containing protein n=1 Tax=Coniella lustricola TaxID=2025994 RepID=A0A2T3AJK8_9PEZI|nr:Alb1-domain-containing protein [Coniella lustricola]
MAKFNAKKVKPPSIHSRAARRATSPSINTDKSLKAVQAPEESLNQRPSVLGIHQNAGVSKRIKRSRKSVLSSRARKRHERGLERAEEIVDRTANKVAKSKESARNIDSRRKAWDEINASAGGEKAAALNKFASLMNEEDDDDDENESAVGAADLDDEMQDAQQSKAVKPARVTRATTAAAAAAAVAAAAAPTQNEDDIDEIL